MDIRKRPFGLLRGGDGEMCSVAVVFQEHHVLFGGVVVEHVDAVGVDILAQDHTHIGPVNQVGRGIAVLLAEAAGVAAVPVEEVVELAQAAAASENAGAVLVNPVEIVVNCFV
jgi:hypothetical protein